MPPLQNRMIQLLLDLTDIFSSREAIMAFRGKVLCTQHFTLEACLHSACKTVASRLHVVRCCQYHRQFALFQFRLVPDRPSGSTRLRAQPLRCDPFKRSEFFSSLKLSKPTAAHGLLRLRVLRTLARYCKRPCVVSFSR